MERHCLTGQSPQWAVVPMEEEDIPNYIQYCTGWGKITSILSVGYCEGRGGHRRVGLGSKGAGSWEVPVTTHCSCKGGVVQ